MTDITPHIRRWNLTPDGDPFESTTSVLAPVLFQGQPAMLKVLKPISDEQNAHKILSYWGGQGAVAMFEGDETALVLERLEIGAPLKDMSIGGKDVEAAAIIGGVLKGLRTDREAAQPDIQTLETRFDALLSHPASGSSGSLYHKAAETARALLASATTTSVLHGDIHHENILHGPHGWVAIDPKGILGDPGYDMANTLLNPIDMPQITCAPGRAEKIAEILASATGEDPNRILRYGFAHAVLSSCWTEQSGADFSYGIRVAEMLCDKCGVE